MTSRLAAFGVGENVSAAATPAAEAYLVRSTVGSACRVRTNAAGSCFSRMMTRHASTTSLASAGRRIIRPGMARSDDQLLDRLMRRAIFADADGVVGEDADRPDLHDRAESGSAAACSR